MIDVFAEGRSEVALSEDEQPVENLGPCRLDPALGDGVSSWRSDRVLMILIPRANTVVTGTVRALEASRETALLRAAQESLANVRKHARASEVTVTLSYMDDITVLDIHDNGIGFVAPARPGRASDGGVGLRAMRERVEQMGGTVTVESSPGDGTTVVIHLPLELRQPEEARASSDTS